MILCYDFEVFSKTPNGDWCVVIVDLLTGEETHIVNDTDKMKRFYESHKDFVWAGYNVRAYDSNILKGILLDIEPRVMNDWLIEQDKKAFELDRRINEIQLYSFDAMYSKILSLKRLEAFMGDDIEETHIPFNTTKTLTEEDWKSVLYYCAHDVYETIKVMTKSKAEFNAQWSLVKEFDLPLSFLAKTKAQLTAEILDCEPKVWNDEWELPEPEYECKIKKYRSVYDWFFKKENQQIGCKQENVVAGVPLVSAWGGGHAAIPNLFRRMNLMCVDVTSFYPSLCIEHNLLSRNPRHKEKFVEIYKKRLQLKAEGKKKEQAPYKIVLNGTFGASGDLYNKLFDPRQCHRTCMTGQIFLLDLMEQLENVCEIIACNTDSVYVSYEQENRDKIIELCHDWERRTKMVLEYDDFPNCMMFQRDVNNYLIVPDGDLSGMKGKGAVVKNLNELDNDCAILNKAVKAFLAHGIEPAETIYADDNLIDFQKIFVKSSAYNFVYVGAKVEEFKEINPETGRLKTYRRPTSLGTILTDKTFRVFASMNEVGTLYKSKELGKDLAKFAGAPDNCFVYNKSVKDLKVSDFQELDRQWYIDTTWDKIIQFYTDKKIKPECVEEIKNEIRQKRKELENG